ncbi:hypothetical protein ISG33_07365 [Glaciecola sp. MH2013]|uniref:hypothetical protein n=1 Tax=Glaciecola sp. MH2013 TaxID=2785524 RepID=UPI0018A0579E|nr:hypothetical protein [Glaciecola sp. MH2013]MBF7073213.1 hypothetical protein [Glaciecola sp. MH2013]
MSNLFIGVKRIIAVDSSEFAYAELDVDAHSMLVAEGNVGKSSLINAIRLFFLPECSMAKQAKNFGFSDSHGEFYHSEETFNHYFPSKYSFLILEYEKRVFDGPHCCQIISASQSGRLRIERLFTQLPFAQFQHLFWQLGDDPDGIGERVDKLSKQGLYDFIQKHDSTCVLSKETSKTATILYESELQSSRYTLFPLKERSTQSVNSLRALIKLLFVASGKNKKPFTDAIANIIESNKKSSQDQLGFDVSQFKQQHESLKLQEAQLNKIINQETLYHKVLKDRDTFVTYLGMLGDVKPGLSWLKDGKQKLQAELNELSDKNEVADLAAKKASAELRELTTKLGVEKGLHKTKEKEAKSHQAIVNTVESVRKEFPGQDIEFIVEALNEDLIEAQRIVDVVEGRVKRDEVIAEIEIKQQELCQQREKLRFAIEKSEYSLHEQLPKEQVDWLYSINTALPSANVGRELSDSEIQSFKRFYSLFENNAAHFSFFDTQLAYIAFREPNLSLQLAKVEQEIESGDKQKKQISGNGEHQLQQSHSLGELKKRINVNEKDLNALKNYDYAKRRLQDLAVELEDSALAIESLQHLIEATSKKQENAGLVREKAKAAYHQCRQNIEEHSALLKQVEAFATRHHKWLALVPEDTFTGYINGDSLALFESSATNLERLQYSLLTQLRSFIEEQVVEDKHGVKGDAPFWQEITACIDDISEVYGNLDTQRSLLGRQIEEHNQTIGTKKEIIVQNYRLIKAFEKEINHAFEGITINNVESVEFEVGINKQFTSLVNEFAETNLYSDQMQSEDFYQRLVAFAEKFFNKDDSFTLTMDRVIESFEPRVQLRNKSGKEDKKQSNSTNALIKIKLVQLLLKRLMAHECETSLPIVHDEIANIDIGQFDWWLNDLAKAGFKLMAAGTHSTSPELQAKIGRRHVMDALTTALPYHPERNRVYWNGAESFSTIELAEQSELL